MARPATNLAVFIRDKTLELLLEKEPEEISTRDIAKACGVTATSLYYYYKDKDVLFNEVKLCCIEKMDAAIAEQIARVPEINRKKSIKIDPFLEVRAGLEAFRDWAFENSRIALLVMGRLKADINADSEKMKKYYHSTVFAKEALDKLVKKGFYNSNDTLCDACLYIAALWGAIESVLLKRTIPQFWTKRGALYFTDSMINLVISSLRTPGTGDRTGDGVIEKK